MDTNVPITDISSLIMVAQTNTGGNWFTNITDSIWLFITNFINGIERHEVIIFLSAGLILFAWLVNFYLILWALHNWEIISMQWWYDFELLLWGYVESFFELEWMAKPIRGLKNVIGALKQDKRFDPDNEGFVLFFIWFLYPILWIVT